MEIITHALPGRRLTGYRDGSGTPAVVFESGPGSPAEDWAAVQGTLVQLTATFSYDRAGLGRSDRASGQRTCREILDDLRTLLAAVGLPPPYVLVGHSWGGLHARYFAASFPAEIAGLVLVEAVHEEKYARFAQVMSPEQVRNLRAEVSDPSKNAEFIDRQACLEQLRQVERPLAIPLLVVTRRADEDPFHRIEVDLQADFLRLSTRSRQVFSQSTDHFLQKADPGLVSEAIRQVVEAARGW